MRKEIEINGCVFKVPVCKVCKIQDPISMVAMGVSGKNSADLVDISSSAEYLVYNRCARVDKVNSVSHLDHGAGAVSVSGGYAVGSSDKCDLHIETPLYVILDNNSSTSFFIGGRVPSVRHAALP